MRVGRPTELPRDAVTHPWRRRSWLGWQDWRIDRGVGVTQHRRRLKLAAESLLAEQRYDGGWGARPDQISSIVNTAEVLAVLRASGVPADHTAVGEAIAYLARAAHAHPRDPDRGPFARYLAYALMGLSEYQGVSFGPSVTEAHTSIIACLESTRCEGHARWPDNPKPKMPTPSIFATATVVMGLSRSGLRPDLVDEACDWLVEIRVGPSGRAWGTFGSERPNATMTAWAVLALASSAKHMQIARDGASFLAERPNWTREIFEDDSVPAARWQHLTYSLAARACLTTGALTPYSKAIQDVLAFIGSTWSEENKQWREGGTDRIFSVRGTYHATMAYDAARLALAADLEAPVNSTDGHWMLAVGPTMVFARTVGGEWGQLPLAPRADKLLRALAPRSGGSTGGHRSKADLANQLGILDTAVATYVMRLNKAVDKVAPKTPLVKSDVRGSGRYYLDLAGPILHLDDDQPPTP